REGRAVHAARRAARPAAAAAPDRGPQPRRLRRGVPGARPGGVAAAAHPPLNIRPGPGRYGFQPAVRGQSEGMSPRYRTGSNSAGTVVAVIADIMAVILGLWILMYLLDANRANDLVQFVHDAANWLAAWSRDLFTF